MRTQEEIEKLMREWGKDPCWDIEDTEGFEDHRYELRRYRMMVEMDRSKQYREKVKKEMYQLGIDKLSTYQYLKSLEERIERLEEKFNEI